MQSSSFIDVVSLSATAPDPVNDSRCFLPWQWVFCSHHLTPSGGLWSVCNFNPKWETEFRSRSANNAVETAGPVLDSILFSTAVVERELQNLKEARSSGPENIPANFLKELANELSKPLANTFRSSFESGKLPSEWKTANIFPICKGGARTSANNYRPVSLTCICCKIMEAIVKKATIKFLEQNHIPSDLQNGFRQNRSCLSSLLLSTEQWTRALDEDGRVDVIYTDFKQLRSDLIQTYRIVKGRECALDFDEFFELAGTGLLRGHPFKL
ncbi:hypothetical protein SprV_0602237100 [Sparganum proliferum]